MKNLLSITALATVMLNGAGAPAAQLPTFELMGLPITRHPGCGHRSGRCSRAIRHRNAYARQHAGLSPSGGRIDAAPRNH
jgi:hypothetical protein